LFVQAARRLAIIPAHMLRSSLPFLAIAAALAAQQDTPQEVVLRHGLAAEQPFSFRVEIESSIMFEDAKKNGTMRFVMQFAAKPGSTEAGVSAVACTLQRLTVDVDSQNAKVRYDSQSSHPDTGPLQALRELTDAVFTLRVAADGRLAAVAAPAPLEAIAKEHLGSDFRSVFAAYFVPLPTAPQRVGSEWTAETRLFGTRVGDKETPVLGKTIAVTNSQAELSYAFEAPMPPERPGVRFEIRQSDGKATVDLKNGRVLHAEALLLARATRTQGKDQETATSQMRVRADLVLPNDAAATQQRAATPAGEQLPSKTVR
jgi:hypothetical protein